MKAQTRDKLRQSVAAIEPMEARLMLSAVVHSKVKHPAAPSNLRSYPISLTHLVHASSSGSTTPYGITPAQMRGAYGLGTYGASNITFNGNVQGDGSGQTIAIVDAYDNPNALSDLQAFDAYFNLPDPPSFQKLSQTGSSTSLPGTDPSTTGSTWEGEESLDVQWIHVMAPKANIILYEANDDYNTDLDAAVLAADNNPAVSVVSMSFGGSEYNGETTDDKTYFNTSGITYVASTGDSGGALEYPAVSPYVVAVGGTSLSLNTTTNTYTSESAWSSGGGGISQKESRPNFQKYTTTGSTTKRTVPDVSMDADPNTGVPIYDTFDYGTTAPWLPGYEGGTSLAAPLFAGLVAVANQMRAADGLGTLTGSTQTLPYLYELPGSNFHDITTGSNGHAAGTGYDQATGIGSAVANLLVPDLAGTGSVSGRVFIDANGNTVFDAAETALASKTVYLDLNNNGLQDTGEPTATTTSTGVYSFAGEPAGGTVRFAAASLSGYVLVPSANAITFQAANTLNLPVFPTTFSTTTASVNYTFQTDSTGSTDQILINGSQAYSVAKSVINSAALAFSLTGSGDSFTVNGANGNPIPAAGITVTGATAGDVMSVIGTAAGNDAFTVTSTTFTFGTSPITFSKISSLLLDPGAGLDSLAVNSGSVTVVARSTGSGILTRNFSSLTVAAAASALFANPAVHTNRMLIETTTLSAIGKLDLGGNDLVIHGGSLTTITNLIASGYNNGAWTGNGLSSSAAAGDTSHLTALGVIQNTLYGGASQPQFDGISPATTDILVKYTYYGDTTLDGKVDGTDYSRIDNGYLTNATGWTNGDFNFDAHVDGSDYSLIDNAFNTQGSQL